MKRAMAQEKSDDKYSRQALIEGWDQRNMNAAVAVAGLGRAGFIVADCMARAGVATLYLVDSADRAGAAKPAIEQVSGAKVYAVAADSQYVRGCSAIVNALQDKNLEEILLRNAAVNKVPVISIRTNGMQGEVLEAGGQMPAACCRRRTAGIREYFRFYNGRRACRAGGLQDFTEGKDRRAGGPHLFQRQ